MARKDWICLTEHGLLYLLNFWLAALLSKQVETCHFPCFLLMLVSKHFLLLAGVLFVVIKWNSIHHLQVVQQALDDANLTEGDLSAVAVTIGPGLSLCLRGNLIV